MAKIHRNLDKIQPKKITIIPHGRLKKIAKPMTARVHDVVQAVTAFARAYPPVEIALRQGRFDIRLGSIAGKSISAEDLVMPVKGDEIHIIPTAAGAANGRGKAVLGLTLLGLSFVPGASLGPSFGAVGQSFGTAAAASFEQFGSQLLGRAGSLLLLSGLAEMVSPQTSAPAGNLPSASLSAPATSGQGAAVPLVYGEVRISRPVVISSGITVDTATAIA